MYWFKNVFTNFKIISICILSNNMYDTSIGSPMYELRDIVNLQFFILILV